MADIFSNATGDWSAAGTWVGGVPPGVGDVGVITDLSGHVVTIDADITCDGLRNDDSGGVGYFLIDTARTINTEILTSVTGAVQTVYINAAGLDVVINGAVSNGGAASVGISINDADDITITGNLTGEATGAAAAVEIGGSISGKITINGNIANPGCNINSADEVEINGDIDPQAAVGSSGMYIGPMTSQIRITGDIYGGAGDGSAGIVSDNDCPDILVTGNVYSGAGSQSPGISQSWPTNLGIWVINGSLVQGAGFASPVTANFQLVRAAANTITVYDDTPVPVVYSSAAGGAAHGVILRG